MARRRNSNVSRGQPRKLAVPQKKTGTQHPSNNNVVASSNSIKPVPVAAPSLMGSLMSTLSHMSYFWLGSHIGRTDGENAVMREMLQNNETTNQQDKTQNVCSSQLNEFVTCSQKYGDGAMCQNFADALSKCVTLNQSTNKPLNGESNEGFSFI